MVKVLSGALEFYVDGILKSNLDLARDAIRKDLDMVICIDGSEGCGKSVMTMQCANYCDSSLTIDRITFNPVEFRNAIIKADKYMSVIYDEAYTGLSSRATMSIINRTITQMLAEIRQKNLFIFVVMPSFFDLDKYVALWRSRALIHCRFGQNFQRGYFDFFGADRKKDLFINGKKTYDYFSPEPNFSGRFTNFYTVNEDEYRKKKRDSLTKRESAKADAESMRIAHKEQFQRLVEMGDKLTDRVKAEILGISIPTYYRWKQEYNDNAL